MSLHQPSRAALFRTRTRIRREARARARRVVLHERPRVGPLFWRGIRSMALLYATVAAAYLVGRVVLG